MDRPEFLDHTEIIFIVSQMFMTTNGISTSVRRRMRLMEDEWGFYPTLLVVRYDPELWTTKAYLEADTDGRERILNPGSRFIGLFEYLCNAYPLNKNIKPVIYERCTASPGVMYEESAPNVYNVFMNGVHTETQFFTANNGRLRRIEKFDAAGTRLSTTWFDDAGQLIRITVWDTKIPDFHPTEYYFTPEKNVRIQAQYKWQPDLWLINDPSSRDEGNHNELAQYIFFDDAGNPGQTFSTHDELISRCLDKLASETDKTVIAVDETLTYSDGVAFAKAPNIARAVVFHSGFLTNSNDLNSRLNPFFVKVCANREMFDGLIFLTNAEKDDFSKKFGSSEKFHVISHFYNGALPCVPFEKRDGNKVVVVSRFDPMKRIEVSVSVFLYAAQQLKDVTLDIYGFGGGAIDTTEFIKKHIEDLGLSDRVFMKGPTQNPEKAFSNAVMFMTTSACEGFPLTPMESVCNGCPAFAFDVKYGLSDIIKDGETGFLFQDKDVKSFAKKMVEFLKDENMRRRMSDNCYTDAARFGKEKFLDKWAEFAEAVMKRG